VSPDFSVVAIVAAFNEADVIGPVVGDLIAQGIQVYFLDDGSTDDTVSVVEPLVGHGVLAIERLREPVDGQSADRFDWEGVLMRKAALARELDADWVIHHDADEFRESPWVHLTLKDAIRAVDARGFNAIDFLSLDFCPDHDHFRAGDDVRNAFSFYRDAAPYDRLQIRCWKQTDGPVDLVSSGGHEARFTGRNVCPLRFLARHYPIRGQAHGERKVFHERRGRLRDEERARGWHVQYDPIHNGASFIQDRSALNHYDPDAVRFELAMRHRGVEALEASLADAVAKAEEDRLTVESLGHQLAGSCQEVQTQARSLQMNAEALARTDRELVAAREALVAARAEIASLRGAAEDQSRSMQALEQALLESQRRVDELHRSRSWRWTSPARAACRAVTGR
jgi:glycosyltransferase involved in cell wall biosynthesis